MGVDSTGVVGIAAVAAVAVRRAHGCATLGFTCVVMLDLFLYLASMGQHGSARVSMGQHGPASILNASMTKCKSQ